MGLEVLEYSSITPILCIFFYGLASTTFLAVLPSVLAYFSLACPRTRFSLCFPAVLVLCSLTRLAMAGSGLPIVPLCANQQYRQYTGQYRQYTGQNRQHTGQFRQYTGQYRQFIGQCRQFTGRYRPVYWTIRAVYRAIPGAYRTMPALFIVPISVLD